IWTIEHWCKDFADVEKVLSVPYEPLTYDVSDFARISSEMDGRGIIMDRISDAIGMVATLMEFGQSTMWAMCETEHFARTMDVMHERTMENLRRKLEVNVVDLYRICGPEFATPPYLPPQFFERFVVPQVTDMVDLIHSK